MANKVYYAFIFLGILSVIHMQYLPKGVNEKDEADNCIIFMGNTGVGKSYICNKIFNICSSSLQFESSNSLNAVTKKLQIGLINYSGESYTIVDSPGFFDTDSQENDGINMCKLVNALENCQNIYAVVFVFTDRFNSPHKIWFERICSMIPETYHDRIMLLHNKLGEYNVVEYRNNLKEVQQILGNNTKHNYIWLSYRPDDADIADVIDQLTKQEPFKLRNLVIPEICYEKEEKGEPYEEVVSSNTSDEGHFEDQEKDISHVEWQRIGDRKYFGMFGPREKEPVWVKETTIEKVWVPKMVTRRTIKTYQDVFKVRFDGSRDLHDKIELGSREEVLN